MIAPHRTCHIRAAPPRRGEGIGSILIALGDAGIGVRHIHPRMDAGGMYQLSVAHSPDLAVRILDGIGCRLAAPHAPAERRALRRSEDVHVHNGFQD